MSKKSESENTDRLTYLVDVGEFNIKSGDNLKTQWYYLYPDEKQKINNFWFKKGYKPLIGFINTLK
jgi:hypothetical protein